MRACLDPFACRNVAAFGGEGPSNIENGGHVNVNDDTLARYETALRRVVERSRSSASLAGPDIRLLGEADEFVDEELERMVDDYLRVSATAEAELIGGIEDSLEPPDAAAAWSRTASLVSGDMLVARLLAEIAAEQPLPVDLDAEALDLRESVPGVVMRAVRVDLDDDAAVGMVMAGLRGQEPIFGAADTPGFDVIAAAMDKILDTSGAMMTKALGTAIPSGEAFDEIIGYVLGAGAAGWFTNARKAVVGFFKRVLRKVVDLIEAGVKKLAALFGADNIDELIDKAKDGLAQFRERLGGSTVAGEALGVVLGSESLRGDYEHAFAALPDDARPERAAEATRVANELANRVARVGFAVSLMSVARSTALGSAPPGSVVIAIVGLAVGAYVFWAAHDHLDALRFGVLPDRAVGIRRVLDPATSP